MVTHTQWLTGSPADLLADGSGHDCLFAELQYR